MRLPGGEHVILLAHISDLHVDGTPRAAERVKRAMDHLRALATPPDALLVTGDIADHGDPAEYREVATLLEAPFPVLALPGNHDRRGAMRTALLGEPEDDRPLNSAHHIGDLTILMCDSTIPGHDEGCLDEVTLGWLEDTLADPAHQGPALLALHHPPVPVHHAMPDSVPLTNPGDLADLLTRHPRVLAVLAGHAHTAAASGFAARPVLLAPAVTWTLVIPPQARNIADLDAPVGIALHTIEDRQITTHFRTIAAGS
jgi:3',5'-cyclic AMP phosphodiesterase CpdA